MIKSSKYYVLKKIAEPNGIAILGGGNDENIPIGELKQAYSLEDKIYNRSVNNLSINDAADIYSSYTASLCADTVLLHIGASDLDLLKTNPSDFENKFRELINTIKAGNKKCNIAIVSIKNNDKPDSVSALNRELKYIAQSEQCEYYDINKEKMNNPKQTKEIVSFIYSLGFVRPLTSKRPLYDLVKILFCYDN